MNNHLKLLLYLAMIAGLFILVQNKFNIFDVKLLNSDGSSSNISNILPFDGNNENQNEIIDEEDEDKQQYVEIHLPSGLKVRVDVEVVDNRDEQIQGLSGRRYLGDYEGMLFVYGSDVNNPFWMKDMYIPLDIIFIDAEGYIVDIKKDQQECSDIYCPHIYSKSPYRYVLEVNANFCSDNSIEVGYSMVQYL
jgi:uncharacterized membrane protein (UPF0127 family)